MSAKILLIEDDDILGASISDLLHLESYHVDWITNGQKGLEAAQKGIHDLVILDVMLPAKNGFQVLSELRESSSVPVLILSAKSTAEDKIKGLKLRADDYLAKPFHLEELLLRIATILRRSKSLSHEIQSIQIGSSVVNFNQRSIESEDSENIQLTEKEADLLRLLISNAGKILSRDEILDRVWGANNHPTPRTVDNFILKLRKHIEEDPQNPKHLISQHGVGYGINL
ncbi:MAG: response regulator transcription factor [Bdellovibrionota bacterium]|nr:response regulator transcription factor [Bdellovibrionota bacterium]